MTGAWHVPGARLLGSDGRDRWVADGVIRDAPVPGAVRLEGWVLPGLVDAHVHLSFEAHGARGPARGSRKLIALQLGDHPPAGVLAVRDAGVLPGVRLPATQPGEARIVPIGPFLAPPDFFIPHLYEGRTAAAAVAEAERQAAAGLPWIKVIADYPGPDGNWFAPRIGYPPEVLREIVAAAHAHGARVAAHVSSAFASEVVAAGVDSLEHAPLLTASDLHAMAVAGQAWTPTLSTVGAGLEQLAGAGVPPARAALDGLRDTLPLAAELGVTVLAGTDERPHGSLAEEAAWLHRCGLPAEAVLAAVSWGARAYLGLPGLEPGAPADLVAFAADPREDIGVLARPATVLLGGTPVGGAGAAEVRRAGAAEPLPRP